MSSGSTSRWWSRLLTGDGLRKTRLHTYSGHRIDIGGLAYLPRSLWSIAILKIFGYHQRVPWLGYRAVRHLDGLIRPDWRVLEFGSGMSSLFFARRCDRLISVESDPSWYTQMGRLFTRLGIANVDYRLREADDYAEHPDLPDQSFDLVVVDGLARDRVSAVALRKVKPGGYVFLDNSDVPWPDHKSARQLLSDAAAPDGVRVFNDLYPFQLQVNESIVVKVRG